MFEVVFYITLRSINSFKVFTTSLVFFTCFHVIYNIFVGSMKCIRCFFYMFLGTLQHTTKVFLHVLYNTFLSSLQHIRCVFTCFLVLYNTLLRCFYTFSRSLQHVSKFFTTHKMCFYMFRICFHTRMVFLHTFRFFTTRF
jgi:hypothetical protein